MRWVKAARQGQHLPISGYDFDLQSFHRLDDFLRLTSADPAAAFCQPPAFASS
jgi:hypothetical protein